MDGPQPLLSPSPEVGFIRRGGKEVGTARPENIDRDFSSAIVRLTRRNSGKEAVLHRERYVAFSLSLSLSSVFHVPFNFMTGRARGGLPAVR